MKNNQTKRLPHREGDDVLGFLFIVRDVIIAGVFATGIWVLGEKFHDLGYDVPANIADFIACIVFLSVLPFEIAKHKPQALWGILILFLIFIIAPSAFVFFCLKPKPEQPVYPHFEFRLLKQRGTFDGSIELTNNFFAMNWGPVSIGYLVFPVMEHSDVTLKLDVQNLGPPVSEKTRITITVPKSFSCDPSGWEFEESGEFSTLTCHPPDLLSGDSWELPEIHFRNFPLLDLGKSFTPSYCFIVARAKDSPAELVTFGMIFVSVSTNISEMPFVEPPIKANNNTGLEISPRILRILKR